MAVYPALLMMVMTIMKVMITMVVEPPRYHIAKRKIPNIGGGGGGGGGGEGAGGEGAPAGSR